MIMDIASLLTGTVSPEFRGILRKGRFTRKDTMETGDIVEFVYETERKYMFVVAPEFEGKVHGVDLNQISIEDFNDIIQEYINLGTVAMKFDSQRVDPKMMYEGIKSVVARTRSYRTYLTDKITRTRIIKYEALIG